MAQQTWNRDTAASLIGALASNPNGGVTAANMPGLITNVFGALANIETPAPAAPAKRGQQLAQQPAAANRSTKAPDGKANSKAKGQQQAA